MFLRLKEVALDGSGEDGLCDEIVSWRRDPKGDEFNEQPSQSVFLEPVMWELEATWVPKERLSSVLRVWACSRVSGYLDAQGYHDRASDRMRWCRSALVANIRILRIMGAFLRIKQQKHCVTLAIKALQLHKQNFRRDWLFWGRLLLKRDEYLTSRRTWKLGCKYPKHRCTCVIHTT